MSIFIRLNHWHSKFSPPAFCEAYRHIYIYIYEYTPPPFLWRNGNDTAKSWGFERMWQWFITWRVARGIAINGSQGRSYLLIGGREGGGGVSARWKMFILRAKTGIRPRMYLLTIIGLLPFVSRGDEGREREREPPQRKLFPWYFWTWTK